MSVLTLTQSLKRIVKIKNSYNLKQAVVIKFSFNNTNSVSQEVLEKSGSFE